MGPTEPTRSDFRHFFLRGLAILLPTILTIWILIAAYGFVQSRIAAPINAGVKRLLPMFLSEGARQKLLNPGGLWDQYSWGFDLIGLVLAIILIYTAGALLGSLIGARIYRRIERFLEKLPVIRQVYPSVKQVTEFLIGGQKRMNFSRVVAVEYPRKEVWCLALVTGSSLRPVNEHTGREYLTVFVPSSPTPFTGWVITVPREDTFDLPMSIEEAVRFIVSGGVIVPPMMQVNSENGSTDGATPSAVV